MSKDKSMTSLSSPLLQFISFIGLVILSNAGSREIMNGLFPDMENWLSILIRVVILVVLIALVYPQFRGDNCCSGGKKESH